MSITVLGAGAFGTALAISLAQNGPVTLWARSPEDMQTMRENAARLPGCPFPEALTVTGDIQEATENKVLLLAVPLQTLRRFLGDHSDLLDGKTCIACCKGIELETGLGATTIIAQTLPHATPAILTGPSFAIDIASGLPTALTLACQDETIGKSLQQSLTTANIRLYRTTDTIGAELGGALKNVIAIACGATMGAGLGESARAAIMTRGFAEMQRLATHLNADQRTLAGLSGFGDLTLTCTSDKSRNYRLGLSLGSGAAFDPAVTVEGAATAMAVHKIAREANLDLPITQAIAAVLNNRQDVATAMQTLLARPLKEE